MEKEESKRVGLLDEVRGFAIICMVIYHACYDLKYIFGVDVPIMFESWFGVIRDVFAGSFIFISGMVCRYSRSNMKRGIECFFIGMIMTFVLPFFTDGTIMFGILHLLGSCMMLYGIGEKVLVKLPAWGGIIICAALYLFTVNIDEGYFGMESLLRIDIPEKAYEVGVLFPFGLHGNNFASSDYFPLLPWMFVFFGGSYFGEYAREGKLPKFFYPVKIRWLALIGRYTIWIYVLHQPLIYVLFSIIFGRAAL